MLTFELFRHKLVHRLIHCAADRRQACAQVPTGEDLKIIDLFDRLARGAEHLDPDVSAEVSKAIADPVRTRGLREVLEDLPASIGFSVWPRDATHLVKWMLDQASPPDPALLASRRSRIAILRAGPALESRASSPQSKRQQAARPEVLTSVARDFTGSLSIVGPLIAVWEIAVGLRQRRDLSFVASHPATTSTIVAVKPDPSTRGVMTPGTGTISFQPALGSSLCHVPVRLRREAVNYQPGQVLKIVPRSAGCEVPLVPTQIGDPTASFLCAIVFLAAGVVALKAWLWLWQFPRPDDQTIHVQSSVMSVAL